MKNHSLAFNSFFNVIYRALNIAFPLITAAYIARILNSELIGEVAFAQNIAQYFILVAALGLPNYGTREISKKRGSFVDVRQVFSELFFLNAISTTCALLIYLILIFSVANFQNNFALYTITGLGIVFNYINVDWVYQGFEQYRYIAIRSCIVKILSLAAILFFVNNTEDYLLYALITVLALAGNNVCNIFNLRKMNVVLKVNDLDLRRHLTPVLTLLCTTIAIELYTLLDTTMIGFLCNKDNVAYYNYAIKITKSLVVVVSAIGGVLLPRLSYYRGLNNDGVCVDVVYKTLNVLVFLLLPCAVGLAICAKEVISFLYGMQFRNSVPILVVSTLLLPTLGFSNLFGTQILITYGKERILLIATILGAVSNIVLNWFLIRAYQGLGAAIASIISETIVTLVTFFFARKCLLIKTNMKNFLSGVFACAVMTLVLFQVKRFFYNDTILLLCEIVMGVAVYAGITLLLRNTVSLMFLQKLKSFFLRYKKA